MKELYTKSDLTLIEDYLDGDQAALNNLYNKYWPRGCRVARGAGMTEEEAKDISSATFYKMIGQIKKLTLVESTFNNYFLTIVRNDINEYYRKKKVSIISLSDPESFVDDLEASESSYEKQLRFEASKKQVDQWMMHLTKKEKECVELRMEGAKNQEIAERMGTSKGTVENYVSKVRNKLRKTFPKEGRFSY